MHEKQKKIQQEEEKKMEKQRNKQDKERRLFKAKNTPNFERYHEKFINILEKKDQHIQQFRNHILSMNLKKKFNYLIFLIMKNNSKNKKSKKNESIRKMKKTMQKKPKIGQQQLKVLHF